jgi:hypothetical protein
VGTGDKYVLTAIVFPEEVHAAMSLGCVLRSKAGHEPARAGLGASQHLARCKWARLGLARFANKPENWARPELAYGSVQLDQAREP